MADYTARDLRVARKWLADDSRQPITERVAALIAAERKRALRGVAREMGKRVNEIADSGTFTDENGMTIPLEPDAWIAALKYAERRASRRARGST